MTAKELIKELKKVPADSKIILSSDEEGNSYHDIYQVTTEEFDRTDDSSKTFDATVLWPSSREHYMS